MPLFVSHNHRIRYFRASFVSSIQCRCSRGTPPSRHASCSAGEARRSLDSRITPTRSAEQILITWFPTRVVPHSPRPTTPASAGSCNANTHYTFAREAVLPQNCGISFSGELEAPLAEVWQVRLSRVPIVPWQMFRTLRCRDSNRRFSTVSVHLVEATKSWRPVALAQTPFLGPSKGSKSSCLQR